MRVRIGVEKAKLGCFRLLDALIKLLDLVAVSCLHRGDGAVGATGNFTESVKTSGARSSIPRRRCGCRPGWWTGPRGRECPDLVRRKQPSPAVAPGGFRNSSGSKFPAKEVGADPEHPGDVADSVEICHWKRGWAGRVHLAPKSAGTPPAISGRTPDTLGIPMFLFPLTAREGRVSAKRFARSSSRNPSTGLHPPTPAVFVCLVASPSEPFLKTKPAMLRVFYIGTNICRRRARTDRVLPMVRPRGHGHFDLPSHFTPAECAAIHCWSAGVRRAG